jgi:hypothetical protein
MMTQHTTASDSLANVPHPAGAPIVERWEDINTDSPFRYSEFPHRIVEHGDEPIRVYLCGSHRPGGGIEAGIVVGLLWHMQWTETIAITSLCDGP